MTVEDGVLNRMETGNEVGDLAMGLFGDFVEVTVENDGHIDLSAMIVRTREELEKQTLVICEASFSYGGLYCAVDILRREPEGWAIYEVKSSTHKKDVYFADVAYQKYVLEHCGIPVAGTYLVHLNTDYVRGESLDISQLFRVVDISAEVATEEPAVEPNLRTAERLLASDQEPAIDLSARCHTPYQCSFWHYCTRNIREPSVFDLYRLAFDKKIKYYHQGIISFDQLLQEPGIQNATQLRQIEYALSDKGDYIEPEPIRGFLDTLSYPLYFLDFETMQLPVPRYPGTSPYDQIPFQYSLHYIEREGGELRHLEFLAEPENDPRRPLAERLCRDIPRNACVTAYNKRFECGRIRELAEQFPDLREHLLDIQSNIVDLLIPFQKGWYYNRAMGGSFSIKSVLPALFPNDPALDYHSLEGVHNGEEAMSIFPRMASMSPAERAAARRDLLKYCELDTYAMVKVWEKLREAAEK